MTQTQRTDGEPFSVSFVVPGVPVSQPRQRHRVFRVRGKTIVGNYTPADSPVHTWKSLIRMAAAKAYNGPPINGSIRLDVTCVWPRTKALMSKRSPCGRVPKASKPDFDNVAKAICDALNGWWSDDSRVVEATIRKMYAAKDESPHSSIVVSLFDPEF